MIGSISLDGLGTGWVPDQHTPYPLLFLVRSRLSSNLDFCAKFIVLLSVAID
jgi:hypothetical protein